MLHDLKDLLLLCCDSFNPKDRSEYWKRYSKLSNLDKTSRWLYDYGYIHLKTIKNTKTIENIDMDRWNIEEIPEFLKCLELTAISAMKNRITKLPDFICSYKQMVVLDLTKNMLETLPDNIGDMSSLTIFSICDNRIKKLPESFSKLPLTDFYADNNQLELLNFKNKKLKRIKVASNRIKTIGIFNLKELVDLHVENNLISIIPRNISGMKSLVHFIAHDNRIVRVSDSICTLEFLEYLNLDNNRLEKLPDNLGVVNSLVRLDIRNNKISILPTMPSLLYLMAADNPIKNLEVLSTNQFNVLDIRNCGVKSISFLKDIYIHKLLIENNSFTLNRENLHILSSMHHVDVLTDENRCTCGMNHDGSEDESEIDDEESDN
jgi:Leucine-rich repeat (LRR) protein